MAKARELSIKDIRQILFPVLEKNYKTDDLKIYKENDLAFQATPHFTYLFLLNRWDLLNEISPDFNNAKLIEKLAIMIYNRGGGSGSAYSREEIDSIISTPISNYREALIAIIDTEFRNGLELGMDYDEIVRERFINIIPEIEKAYATFAGKKELSL